MPSGSPSPTESTIPKQTAAPSSLASPMTPRPSQPTPLLLGGNAKDSLAMIRQANFSSWPTAEAATLAAQERGKPNCKINSATPSTWTSPSLTIRQELQSGIQSNTDSSLRYRKTGPPYPSSVIPGFSASSAVLPLKQDWPSTLTWIGQTIPQDQLQMITSSERSTSNGMTTSLLGNTLFPRTCEVVFAAALRFLSFLKRRRKSET